MKRLALLSTALLFVCAASAQFHNSQPFVTGGFGNVVRPAGNPAGNPNLGFPASGIGGITLPNGSPRLVVPRAPGFQNNIRRVPRTGNAVVYAYPVYVGGYGSGYGYGYGNDAMPPQEVQQPQQPAQPSVVIINQYPAQLPPPPALYEPQPQPGQAPAQQEEPAHYLIALKDHTVYSAVAYWVDGDTLHYFTSGNTHNQVSLSLVDRDLTKRLNTESGVTVNLTPGK